MIIKHEIKIIAILPRYVLWLPHCGLTMGYLTEWMCWGFKGFWCVIHIGSELCRRMGSHNPPSYGFTLLEDLAKKRPPNA
jgi:hypothetical protein